MPSIAIGIHVHAEPEQLRATIASVHANTALPFTVVLLPDGADQETAATLAEFANLQQLLSHGPCGAAACFNRLAKNTESEVLVFLESGVRVGPDWLVYLLKALETDPRYGLAGPSTNLSWNEQGVFAHAVGDAEAIADTATEAKQRFGFAHRTLQPLYSLADFCYVVRRNVF